MKPNIGVFPHPARAFVLFVTALTARDAYALPPVCGVSEIDQTTGYYHQPRWANTATNGSTGTAGATIVLTYSFVGDGTPMVASAGCGNSASLTTLDIYLNSIYGSPAVWKPLFHEVMARWSQLGGVEFVYEPNDDGAIVSAASPGVLGLRGDIRFCGVPIDGFGGTFACCPFPDFADVHIDTQDLHFLDVDNRSHRLRNALAHEVGHGLGFEHACALPELNAGVGYASSCAILGVPAACTQDDTTRPYARKVMESDTVYCCPSISHAQHDDIRGLHAMYGDFYEKHGGNDTPMFATSLGNLPVNQSLSIGDIPGSVDGHTYPPVAFGSRASIRNNGDVDFFSFDLQSARLVSITLSPVGLLYDDQQQTAFGCSGSPVLRNTLALADLNVQLLRPDGISVLESADNTGAGDIEQIQDAPSGLPGRFILRVASSGIVGQPQLYTVVVTTSATCPGDIANVNGELVPDLAVDLSDLLAFLNLFEIGDPAGDIDDNGIDPQQSDGATDINDLLFMIAHFGFGC